MKVYGTASDIAAAYCRHNDVFIRTPKKSSDHQNRDTVGARKSLRNIGSLKVACNDFHDTGFPVPTNFGSNFPPKGNCDFDIAYIGNIIKPATLIGQQGGY